MLSTQKKDQSKLAHLIDLGSDITGSGSGAICGFLIGGPIGAVAGAAVGPVVAKTIKKIGTEIATRWLGDNEQRRVGTAIVYTTNKIDEKLNLGMELRDDDFFNEKNNERSSAEEIVEGILLSAQREYQEEKIKLYSNLLANIAFSKDVDKSQANLLLKLANRLSYRQLCLLAILAEKQKFNIPEKKKITKGTIKSDISSILQELYDMYLQGLLIPQGGGYWLQLTEISPGLCKLQGMGGTLFKLMELNGIDNKDLIDLATILEKI